MHARTHHPAIAVALLMLPVTLTTAALIAMTGCAPQVTHTPEQARYLDEVQGDAEQNGHPWSAETPDAVLNLGEWTCSALERGDTLDRIYAANRREDEGQDAVVRLAVTYAPIYLCPEVGE